MPAQLSDFETYNPQNGGRKDRFYEIKLATAFVMVTLLPVSPAEIHVMSGGCGRFTNFDLNARFGNGLQKCDVDVGVALHPDHHV